MKPTNLPILPVSLVLVSDYEAGSKTWSDERAALAHYLSDPTGIPAEVLVVATRKEMENAPPPDFSDVPVPVRVIVAADESSAALKNAATRHCRHDLVSVIEADCLSKSGWLKTLHDAMRADPSLSVVSGRTVYPETGALSRVMTLFDRGFMETISWGDRLDPHISGNAAVFRRGFLEDFPLPEDANPFIAAQLRQDAAAKAGCKVSLVREAVQFHAFGGWPFIRDLRRNKGVQEYRYQFSEFPRPKATLSRWHRAWMVVCRRFAEDARTFDQLFSSYCRPTDWPLALTLLFVVRIWEFQGALQAESGSVLPGHTAFR